ncbi:MAG: SURF1 family protein [Boseongicola sp.]|nr:MAG: SURF1 family protein [Boseongicola sp.]
MRRLILPLIFGIVGTLVLASFGVWQVQRLAWKEAVLAEIDARIVAAPVAVPDAPNPVADKYLPVVVSGRTTGEALEVLVSVKQVGAGYRVISVFETVAGRRLLLDEGFVPVAARAALPVVEMEVVGNLHWPDEVDSFTPEPDLSDNLIFARDVPFMAEVLKTEPVLVIARSVSGTDRAVTPLPVTSEGIPNNHLGYAVQWFGLAIVWAGMTAFFLWRMRRSDREDIK